MNRETVRRRREARAAWLFLAPALAVITVFFFMPVAAGLLLSFTDFDIYSIGNLANVRLVGVHNYAELLRSSVFWRALLNTFYFVVVGGPLTIGLALALASLVNSRLVRLKGLFRTVFFAPVVTTVVTVAVVFRYLYSPRAGLLNALLGAVGLGPVDWLGDPRWAMPAIILFAVWKNFGYDMIIFVAGLQAIPDHLYEAARIDGAGAWQRFRRITVPMLRPSLVFVSIITVIGYFQLFAEPYVMTRGGPLGATLSVVLFMYEQGFRWWNMGFAAAVAFVLFVIIFAVTLLQVRLRRGGEA